VELTKEQAIDISIELWTWLAETGSGRKLEWQGWKKYGAMGCGCALCAYTEQQEEGAAAVTCKPCPYYRKFHGKCFKRNRIYAKWEKTNNIDQRKKYASQFLEQLRQLKEA